MFTCSRGTCLIGSWLHFHVSLVSDLADFIQRSRLAGNSALRSAPINRLSAKRPPASKLEVTTFVSFLLPCAMRGGSDGNYFEILPADVWLTDLYGSWSRQSNCNYVCNDSPLISKIVCKRLQFRAYGGEICGKHHVPALWPCYPVLFPLISPMSS